MEYTPYLTFHGQANNALKFYQTVLGGQLIVQHAGDLFHTSDVQTAKLVVHGVLTVNESFHITALDVIPGAPDIQTGNTVSMGLHFDNLQRAESVFAQLKQRGTVVIPFTSKDWGGTFGIVTDQFGVRWNIDA